MSEIRRGIFAENPLFTLLLGLCPAIAVSARLADALVLSLGMIFVLTLSSVPSWLLGGLKSGWARAFLSVIIVGAHVTLYDALLAAWLPSMRQALGIYLPVLAANCLLLGRTEVFYRSQTPGKALRDALGLGIGFAGSLAIIATLREVLSAGTITFFADAAVSRIEVPALAAAPIRAFALPAGGLLVLGYLVGLKRALFDGRGKRA